MLIQCEKITAEFDEKGGVCSKVSIIKGMEMKSPVGWGEKTIVDCLWEKRNKLQAFLEENGINTTFVKLNFRSLFNPIFIQQGLLRGNGFLYDFDRVVSLTNKIIILPPKALFSPYT